MHKVIWLIVECEKTNSPLSEAQEWFDYALKRHDFKRRDWDEKDADDDMMERPYGMDGPFDYCKVMESGHDVAGSDRFTSYKDRPTAYPADHREGLGEIMKAFSYTRSNFFSYLEEVSDSIEELDKEEIFIGADTRDSRGSNPGLTRARFNWMHDRNGTELNLFDCTKYGDDAKYIADNRDFAELMESDLADKWVVPLDVHY